MFHLIQLVLYDCNISFDVGSIPTAIAKVGPAFHSLDGVGKMSGGADERLAWLTYS